MQTQPEKHGRFVDRIAGWAVTLLFAVIVLVILEAASNFSRAGGIALAALVLTLLLGLGFVFGRRKP